MNATRRIRNLALVGFMGTGKTTVGHALAAQLGFAFVDTDHLIEGKAGRSISEIFATAGEGSFRGLEAGVVEELAARDKTVIATGGGLICFGRNLEVLKSYSFVVGLWATPDTIFERVRHHAHRPLLNEPDPLAKIRSLLEQRESFYRQADLLVSTDGRPVREIVQHILHEFHVALESPAPC